MSSPNKSVEALSGGPISLSKVRNIVKLSSDVTCMGTAQCVLLAKVADMFTSDLIHAAYLRSTSKMIDYHDLCEIVHEDESLDFIHPLIPKQMTYAKYKEWLLKRGDDSSVQPTLDLGAAQQGHTNKIKKKNKVVKNLKSAKDKAKNKKKVLSVKRKKPVVMNGNTKKAENVKGVDGIKKYFVKVDK